MMWDRARSRQKVLPKHERAMYVRRPRKKKKKLVTKDRKVKVEVALVVAQSSETCLPVRCLGAYLR